MRIAHVSDCYLPRMGGIERQVHGLAVAQQAAGHDVRVITSTPTPAGVVLDDPVPVTRPGRPSARPGGIRYLASRNGRDAVRLGAFDVVHIHASTWSPLAYLAAQAACADGIPTVVTAHSLWSYATPVFRFADGLLGWRRWPIVWTAVSRYAAVSLQQVLGDHANVAVLPNAVAAADWRVQIRPRQPSRVVIASVMRLAARKRPLRFLDMMRALRAQLPDHLALEVQIVGDGPQRDDMQNYLRGHRMTGWVQLHGQLPPEGIREVFSDSDIYVSPARLESFGIAALEASTAGLPVVAFAATGVSDFVVNGQNGFLVDSDEHMVSTLAVLATSPALNAQVAAAAATGRSGLTWEHALKVCEASYATAVGLALDASASRPSDGSKPFS
jgi:glycosyltransferase involved in cell wall biosynthesis